MSPRIETSDEAEQLWFRRTAMLTTAVCGCLVIASHAAAQDDVVEVQAVEVQAIAQPVADAFQLKIVADPALADDAAKARRQLYRRQLAPLVEVELSFAKRTCKLSPQQLERAIAVARKTLDEFIRDHEQALGRVLGNPFLVVNGQPQPVRQVASREELTAEVVRLVKSLLTPEQQTPYDDEIESRRRFHKQAVIENVVAKLDQELHLSERQRGSISATLDKNWDAKWAPKLNFLIHAHANTPDIPEDFVLPHLGVEQQSAWRSMQRVANHVTIGMAQMQDEVIDDVDLGIDD